MPPFTYYRQYEEMDCGAACLRMVAQAHGMSYGLEELRERTHLSRSGVSLLGISEGAESIGLQTLALPVTVTQLGTDIPLPCILPWRGSHFVVLYGLEDGSFLIADPDPTVQLTTISIDDLTQHWAHTVDERGQPIGNVLVLEPTPEFSHRSAAQTKTTDHWQYLKTYLGGHRTELMHLLLGLVLATALQIAFPFLIRALVDQGIVLRDPGFVTLVVVAQGVLLFSTVVLAAVRRNLLIYLSGRANVGMVSEYLAKLLRLPLDYFDSRSTNDILQRVLDHDRLRAFFSGETILRVLGLTAYLAFAVVLLVWSLPIFLLFLAGTLVQALWVRRNVRRHRGSASSRLQDDTHDADQLVELVEGIADLKQYRAGTQKRWAWERHRVARARNEQSRQRSEQWQRSVSTVIIQATALAISFVSATAVIDGRLSIGTLVAIHYVMAQLGNPATEIGRLLEGYEDSRRALERIAEVRQKEEEASTTTDQPLIHYPKGDLVLQDISFSYPVPQSIPVIDGLSLRLPEGKLTAIVGPSGSGKSTLLKLLLGFYSPTAGSIKLGDHPLSDFPLESWRQQIALVSNEGYLFTDSIAANLSLGYDTIDQDRLRQVARIAQIESFIDQLPNGYATVIGPRGLSVSRGQRQRLLLARALYHRPAYLLLDEATSGLDAFMEVTIMDELLKYMEGSTIVTVAHRYATFERADQIVLLEQGKIVEQGKHDALMQDRRHYYRLVQNQIMLGS
jgi:ATP-binding cassette subfamily B protein